MTDVATGEVEAFISERCADFKCPACGGSRLEPAAEGRGQPIALLYENSPAKSWFGPPGYLRVLALNCASCSYVMIFKLDAVEKWVRARTGRDRAPVLSGNARHAGADRRALVPNRAPRLGARHLAPS